MINPRTGSAFLKWKTEPVSHIRIVKKQAAWYHKSGRKRRGEIKKGSGNYVSEINDMSGKCKRENRF